MYHVGLDVVFVRHLLPLSFETASESVVRRRARIGLRWLRLAGKSENVKGR